MTVISVLVKMTKIHFNAALVFPPGEGIFFFFEFTVNFSFFLKKFQFFSKSPLKQSSKNFQIIRNIYHAMCYSIF